MGSEGFGTKISTIRSAGPSTVRARLRSSGKRYSSSKASSPSTSGPTTRARASSAIKAGARSEGCTAMQGLVPKIACL